MIKIFINSNLMCQSIYQSKTQHLFIQKPNQSNLIYFLIKDLSRQLPVMQSSIIPDSKYQELKISFTFDEKHQNKLIIKTLVDNDSYILELDYNPDLDFEEIKTTLLQKQFKLTLITSQLLKIKIGVTYFEFHNIKSLQLNALKSKASQLDNKLKEQSLKNIRFEEDINKMNGQIDQISTKYQDLARSNDQKSQDIAKIKKQQAQLSHNYRQCREETLKMQRQIQNSFRVNQQNQYLTAELKKWLTELMEKHNSQQRKIAQLEKDLCQCKTQLNNQKNALAKQKGNELVLPQPQPKPNKEEEMVQNKNSGLLNFAKNRVLGKSLTTKQLIWISIILACVVIIGSIVFKMNFSRISPLEQQNEPILDKLNLINKGKEPKIKISSIEQTEQGVKQVLETNSTLKMQKQRSNETLTSKSSQKAQESTKEKLKDIPRASDKSSNQTLKNQSTNATPSKKDYKFSLGLKAQSITLTNNSSVASNPGWTNLRSFALVEDVVSKNGSSIRFVFQKIGWFSMTAVGLCIRDVVAAYFYRMKPPTSLLEARIGHGSFTLNRLGTLYSHSVKEQILISGRPQSYEGDVIRLETIGSQLLFVSERTKKEMRMEVPLTENQWQQAYFCAYIDGGDIVRIDNRQKKC